MPTHTALVIANASVKIGADSASAEDFGDAIPSAALQTTYPGGEIPAVSGNAQEWVGAPKDAVALTVGDSIKDGELWDFLDEHHGQYVYMEFAPQPGTGNKSFAGEVLCKAPASLGGGPGHNTSTIVLPFKGRAQRTTLA